MIYILNKYKHYDKEVYQMKKEITGVMVYYYAVCKRKLWYFYNEIQMEQGNEMLKQESIRRRNL